MAYFVTLLFFVILVLSFYVIIKDTLANMPKEELHAEDSPDEAPEDSLRANSAQNAEESEPS